MTLVDLLTLVAGMALGVSPLIDYQLDWPVGTILLVQVVLGLSGLFHLLTLAFSIVVLGRVVTYRRMPRPAEWLTLVVSATIFVGMPGFDLDGWADLLLATPGLFQSLEQDGCLWMVDGVFSLAVLATLGIVRLGRRVFPPWLKTLLLILAAVLVLTGPLWAFDMLGPALISPSGGFGAGTLAILHYRACQLIAAFPTGVFFGVPAVATVLDRLAGRRWAWSEWAGVATSTLAGVVLEIMPHLLIPASPAWPAERALGLVWCLIVALTSRIIVAKLSRPWWRWIGAPVDQDQLLDSSINLETFTF